MCGIAGIYRRRDVDDADRSRLGAMTAAIRHRGPDDEGYLLLDSTTGRHALGRERPPLARCDVLLGHRRLAIIDLSAAGRQPLGNETGEVFIVFNGAIYNHVELRRDLVGRGHVFASATDSEVIVHAYEEWGDACVARFNGMWAFAIWDQRRRRLFCSRDRFGIKPFYYVLDERTFLFASEVKALLPALPFGPRPNYAVVADYLARTEICRGPETFFAGVRRLEPAHNLVVERDRAGTRRFWDYGAPSGAYDHRDPVRTFRELFDDAVRLRLRSDVPVGVMLSGGLDSTSVLASASAATAPRPLRTFTAVFPGFRGDESRYARLAARRFGAEAHTVEYGADDLLGDLERLIWHLDYPALDAQILARWRIIDLARRHVKVILEGQGADEILAGYRTRYLRPYVLDELRAIRPGGGLAGAKRIATASWDGWRTAGLAPFLPARLLAMARRQPSVRAALSPEILRLARGAAGHPGRPFRGALDHLLYRDHAQLVLPRLLKFGDAISMAGSVEARVPFLDHRLVEFAFQRPFREKLDGRTSKVILRQAFGAELPPEILGRHDKIGFDTPIEHWLRAAATGVRSVLLAGRARGRDIFDPTALERLLRGFETGRWRVANDVFRCLSVELWFRRFVDAPPSPPSTARGGSRMVEEGRR
jgi:asparagine synthase (glutamine-hydrolysing)